MLLTNKIILISLITCTLLGIANTVCAKIKTDEIKKEQITDFNHINITNELTKDLKGLKAFIEINRPKAIYLEQWITAEPHNKKLLKKLSKIAKKHNIKFYLVIGKNTWFGNRGVSNTLASYEVYEKYIDGIVLRVEPNKVNVWKDDLSIKAQILNQMLDAYSGIYQETKKREKQFLVEFPFWFSDFKGPKASFSEDACKYSDKISFLIDDIDQLDLLDDLDIQWNDITCRYNINLTKRAINQNEEGINKIYKRLKAKLPMYSNFNGFIIDSDSTLLEYKKDNQLSNENLGKDITGLTP